VIRLVLVPLDGSPAAEAALGHGVTIATAFRAELILLRVVEAHAALTDPLVSSVDWRLQRAEASAYLQEMASRLEAGGVKAATEVAEGRAADEIVQLVRDRAVDLVVLASHGQGGARDFALGGTVHKVLASADASVMIIRPGTGGAPAPAKVEYRRVLAPVDGSPAGEWALCQAASVAREQGAELLLVQIVAEVELTCDRMPRSAEETRLVDRLQALQHARGERYLEEMRAKLSRGDLRVRCRVAHAAEVVEGVLEAAREEGADLIALSAHGATGAAFPYGKVAQRLLARSEIPVLVFQDLPGGAWGERPPARASVR
jgi:nucleotide-binding universal stress UspA family protein